MTIVAVMLSLGQWNDTKDALSSVYKDFVTNWTNDIEYKQISTLHVGQTQDYVTSVFGTPHVSKKSKSDADVNYFYYGNKKYQLTLAIKDERLSGYAVVGLDPDFQVSIPYTDKTLLSIPLNSHFSQTEAYYSDANNLEYYAESHDLGKKVMFYNLILGVVNYGNFSPSDLSRISNLNADLDRGLEDVSVSLAASRKLQPNYFAITELAPQVMVEGLLTHFEYKTLLKIQ
ncbi:ETEC_3214 domain-containing protein [Shewanella benthica]|uniref:ETEC_3214 domain-containing protein n=1 Tax=Shewanella benthica TaxID=43661 RepID=UPI0011AE5749|nr:ETEC_3214 domain-containing protein [Shewanella benthica]